MTHMTKVNLPDLGVKRSVWTSVIANINPIIAKKLYYNVKSKNRVVKKFPLYILQIPCISGSKKGNLEATLLMHLGF